MSSKRLPKDKYNLIPANNDATAVSVFTYRAAGTAWIIQVWKLFNRNQSPPQISSLIPGERLSGKSTLPSAHQQSLRLEKHNCHCWRMIEKRGRYAPALLIGGCSILLNFIPTGILCNHTMVHLKSIDYEQSCSRCTKKKKYEGLILCQTEHLKPVKWN